MLGSRVDCLFTIASWTHREITWSQMDSSSMEGTHPSSDEKIAVSLVLDNNIHSQNISSREFMRWGTLTSSWKGADPAKTKLHLVGFSFRQYLTLGQDMQLASQNSGNPLYTLTMVLWKYGVVGASFTTLVLPGAGLAFTLERGYPSRIRRGKTRSMMKFYAVDIVWPLLYSGNTSSTRGVLISSKALLQKCVEPFNDTGPTISGISTCWSCWKCTGPVVHRCTIKGSNRGNQILVGSLLP